MIAADGLGTISAARRKAALIGAALLTVTACSESGGQSAAGATIATATTTPSTDATTNTTVAVGAAGSSGETSTGGEIGNEGTGKESSPFEATDFGVGAGTEQLTITDAEPGQILAVFELDGTEVTSAVVDERGAIVFRDLEGGVTYVIGDDAHRSEPVMTLQRDQHPAPDSYSAQSLPTDGLGYIATRDGTTLSASVWLPGPAEDGPYPTVVEYSGYSPSDPGSIGFPDTWNALGYAYVGVNIRGTGCSGGSFHFFEYAQSLDGYDTIETVAAQPWVLNNRVGMVGISYAGISQLFVAQTQPPNLAAITPFSALADSAISTLYPGGILNTGFAVRWTEERLRDAEPEGQAWTVDRIAAGDTTCETNQDLRLQNADLIAMIEANEYWTDEVAAPISPNEFIDQIRVPTFVAGAWQDEQTGGHFATMLGGFTGTEHLYATVMNGLHTESISPAVLPRMVEFLDLYVAERTPSLAAARQITPLLSQSLFGTSDVSLPPQDRFEGLSHAEALAAFEGEPSIEVLFEQGAADSFPPLAPLSRYSVGFESWPIPEADTRTWHLAGDRLLADEPAQDDGESSYLALPDATPPTWFDESSGNIWSVDVEYDWLEGGPGTFVEWVTEPLVEHSVVIGSGSVDLWMSSNFLTGPAPDTDIEATITEIRPDGQELYVQSGWLRASHRALDEARSTELRPVHTHREEDAEPLPEDEHALVRVELFPFAHTFRAGSRIRLIVDAPGGQRPVWEFRTLSGGEEVSIAYGPQFPSQLVLPVVEGIDVPETHPSCESLRGQPCRTYTGSAPSGG